jgi:hypothetical protein
MWLKTSCQSVQSGIRQTVSETSMSPDRATQIVTLPAQDHLAQPPPDHCSITGRIIRIFDRRAYPPSPCADVPCTAIVRIERLHAVGMNFPDDIIVDSDYTITFSCTLAATNKEQFPFLTEHFPGLNIGSRFMAQVRHIPGFGSGTRQFEIDRYTRLP